MTTPVGPYLKRIADACTKDLGKRVLPGDIYGMLEYGEGYDPQRTRFSNEERMDIFATMVKEMDEG